MDDTAGTTDPERAAAKAASAGRWEDFVDIFHAPSQVFARRESSGYAVPMLVVTLVLGGIFLANSGVLQPIMDAEFARASAAAMRRNPQITPEMMDKGRRMGEVFAKIGVFIGTPIALFLIGLVLWVVGKLFGAVQTLSAAVMVASYSYVPKIVEGLLLGVQGLLMDSASLDGRYRLSFSPARFLDPETTSPVLLAMAGRVDLFTIWVSVLLAIGLAVTGRIPRRQAALAVVIVWICGFVPALVGAMRS